MRLLLLFGLLLLTSCGEPPEPKTLECDGEIISKKVVKVYYNPSTSLMEYRNENDKSTTGFRIVKSGCRVYG